MKYKIIIDNGKPSEKEFGTIKEVLGELIELTIEGISYRINLIEFIKIMKKNLKGKHYRG